MPVIVATGPTLKIDSFLLLLKIPFLLLHTFHIKKVFIPVKSVSCREVYDSSVSFVICTTTIQVLYNFFGKFLDDSRKHFYLRIVI